MNAIIIGLLGFAAGMIFGNSVRSMIQPMLPEGIQIPSFYGARSYQSNVEYDTTRSSFAGAVTERDYDSELETHINHIPME